MLQVLSIGIDILTEQHDFHNTICYQMFDLSHNIFRIPASLTTTDIRYDTVTTEIIASKHNVDTGFELIFSIHRQIFHDLIGIFPDINDHAVRFHRIAQQFREFENIMGSEDQIHEPITLFQLFHYVSFLHHTATQSDHHMRFFLFHAAKISQTAVDTLIGIFTDGAGVINNKICFVFFFRLDIPDRFQNTIQFFGIAGVHLTPKRSRTCIQRAPQFF